MTSSVWSPRATSTSAVYSHAHPTGTVDSEVVASGKIRSGYGGIREPWNAEYIALMQPAVGAAVADWLTKVADFCDGVERTHGKQPPADNPSVIDALTVARLINGEDGAA
ncbi:hypothetical protein [Streptomyces sp. NPDC093676]|uniref:hypothetical protein n=1 Tax=Streptomyces sp. NPDC093676 TaxID=3366050 RepID=UPI0038113FC0